ncbi:hypothetical protein Ddye_023740 [Dipteronia dyeriana]|uniref:Uncharacterized protein n=1 Tax=Dipteronia dyeriana TaxID=168575 RepID=A0AAD9TTI4_9ROSI|nr:hypothetical protein Ddye_023740 [Dipteronia dyeriana]
MSTLGRNTDRGKVIHKFGRQSLDHSLLDSVLELTGLSLHGFFKIGNYTLLDSVDMPNILEYAKKKVERAKDKKEENTMNQWIESNNSLAAVPTCSFVVGSSLHTGI